MSERFLFMPSVGFCLGIVLLLNALPFSKIKEGMAAKLKPLLAISGVILLVLSAKTIHRNLAWKSNFALFTTDVEVSRNSAKLRNSAGGELTAAAIKIKDEAKRTAMLQEAVGHLQTAIKIHPTLSLIHI